MKRRLFGALKAAAVFSALLLASCGQYQSNASDQPAPEPQNLALGKPVTASQALADSPPEHAVDGEVNTLWGAGGFAPQWIEIDLGQQATIVQVRLTVAQTPAGVTAHRVWGLAAQDEGYRLLHDFIGETQDGAVLEHTPEAPWEGVRYVRVETLNSPSWVAWREVEVMGQVVQQAALAPPVDDAAFVE